VGTRPPAANESMARERRGFVAADRANLLETDWVELGRAAPRSPVEGCAGDAS